MNIGELPGETMVPLSWVREHFVPKVSGESRDMSTVELSKHLGRSASWWQDMARKGKIDGAYQVGAGSPWYVPLPGASAFLERYRADQTEGRRRRARRPWGARKA